MKMQTAPVVGLIAAANAYAIHGTAPGTGYTTTTTLVTSVYETYCPVPTTFAYNNVTYTATVPTTITITSMYLLRSFAP